MEPICCSIRYLTFSLDSFPVRTLCNYTDLSLQLANPGTQFATEFKQSFAGPGTTGGTTNPNNREYGFFVQDDWRVTPKLTINPGLRYDYQSIAKPPIQNPDAAF